MEPISKNTLLQKLNPANKVAFNALYKQNPAIFNNGKYTPLKVKGKYKTSVLAFAINYEQNWYVIALPLTVTENTPKSWDNTKIVLPRNAPAEWQHLLSATNGYCDEAIMLSDIFKASTFAIVKLIQPVKERGAGILMHITSIPSAFSIGDMGPGAFSFADFLINSRQKYWQMLPVNPTEARTDHSPYSSTSSMAGNTLLISPELLLRDGLLTIADLEPYSKKDTHKPVDYSKASAIKTGLFQAAYHNFLAGTDASKQKSFKDFKNAEAYWLDDYAFFEVLTAKFAGKPWHEWPAEYKFRKNTALTKINKTSTAELDKVKWLQFIFSTQWKNLKHYCNSQNVKLFGDMPFYMNYNSADVWAQPQIFNLDAEGKVKGMAGVPPDYFSADGQLWGMPVYKWDVLKKDDYKWWISRIGKNLEYFDLIRLDHFRAFADFWEVPAGEKTAINGTWKLGPGNDFFNAVEKKLGHLPLIAEDLGDMNDLVYNLRDDFKLPGMKVLQFAFDQQMQHSIHIPHNHVENSFVYTGTHDNNTTSGWYDKNTSKDERKRIKKYTGKKLKGKTAYQTFVKMAYASVAKVAIIPMQDVLGLDETNRMNVPSSEAGNWSWRLADELDKKIENGLRELVNVYNR